MGSVSGKRTSTRSIDRGSYISFATLKRSGEFVATPVWFAPEANGYYLFSASNAGKIKRLRNFSRSRIAPCTVTGKVTGDWIATEAHILDDPARIRAAVAALHKKYGWQMKLTDCLSRLSGKIDHRAYIRVDLRDDAD